MGRSELRVVQGREITVGSETDPARFQAECIEAYTASWVARGFSPVTIENDAPQLERVLAMLGRPAWDVSSQDVDRVVGELAAAGLATATRRGYVQSFKGFHRFLVARKAAQIEAVFGVRLECPVDEFNASRHAGDESSNLLPPPTVERVNEFFDFMKTRIATARKYAPAARDYALFRTLYHAGLRADEASSLELCDVHVDRGPFGKLHVRFGKAAHGSGPRPRWVPMLDGLDVLLGWFVRDVRPRFPQSPVLFADESGGALHRGTIRNRLRYLQELEGRPVADRFSPHALRRACATHNYERGVDLSRSSSCSVIGRSARRCDMSSRQRRSSKTPIGVRFRPRWPAWKETTMQIRWKLRMAAAQREVWTAAQLRRLLGERAGLEMSSASVSALFAKHPAQVKLSTLAALCTALECTPNDLIEVDTTPLQRPVQPAVAAVVPQVAAGRGRSMPPM